MPKHGRHTYNVDNVLRALQHHRSEGRITHLALDNDAGRRLFHIRLAASYDMDILDYTLRDAFMLSLGLTTGEKVQQAELFEAKRLTFFQEAKLRKLCEDYGVEFERMHYTPAPDLPTGWVNGWIGGPEHANKTIYVGVDPEGHSHS